MRFVIQDKEMKVKDYYKIMGLSRTASGEQIKDRYKELAKIYHPDLHAGDEAMRKRFDEIAEAYSVLGNLQNRLKYSLLLHKNKTVLDKVSLMDYAHRNKKTL